MASLDISRLVFGEVMGHSGFRVHATSLDMEEDGFPFETLETQEFWVIEVDDLSYDGGRIENLPVEATNRDTHYDEIDECKVYDIVEGKDYTNQWYKGMVVRSKEDGG